MPRQWRAAPQGVIPIAAQNPFARLQVRGVLLQPAYEFLGRGGVPQIHRGELKAAVDKMRVAIGESRHDQAAVGLKDSCVGTNVASDLSRIADREDLVA